VSYTFTDGLTLTGSTVRNDLVTGVEVAHVNAQTAGGAELQLKDDGSVLLKAAAALGRLEISPAGGVDLVSAAAEDINITSGLAVVMTMPGLFALSSGASVGLQSADAMLLKAVGGPLTLDTDGAQDIQINSSHDELHTVGRNFDVQAAGSTGITLNASHVSSGRAALTAATKVTIQGDAAPGKLLAFFAGAGAEQQWINGLLPETGNDVDIVAVRLNQVITGLFNYTLFIPNPT
jgi:hypothetical protein